MSFGARLKKARKEKKLTQEEVAKRLGIDDTTISKYENDRSEPDNKTLTELAELYGVSIDYLHGRTEDNDRVYNDAETTIRLIEEEATKMGLTTDDPRFQKLLSDAFDLLRVARGQDKE